jgi:hypothetical protein
MQVRFKVLTAASIRMVVFWDVVTFSLIDTDRRFRSATASICREITLMMEAVSTSET